MAAAEYYNAGGGANQGPPSNAQFQYSQRPNPPPPQMSPLPYPISDAPPPYTPYEHPRPQSQPPPQQRPVGPGAPGQYGPQNGQQQYPPEKGSRLQNMYRPSDFLQSPQPTPQQPHPQYHAPPPQQQPPQQNFYQHPQGAMSQVYGNDGRRPSSTPVLPPRRRRDSHSRSRSRDRSRDRSRERSRSRPRRRHHHDQQQRPDGSSRKKSSGISTFLGAGGGALIGDAIFPGLGTLSGAILGGVGGHEYGKQKRSYSSGTRTRPRAYSNEGEYYDDRRRRKY